MNGFYLGVHRPHWLATAGVPLFVSHRTLRSYKTLPKAIAPWALDSGGFTELSLHGKWVTTPEEYVAAVRRYRDEIGMLQWASPQDWMNEPVMLAKTGLTVEEHQRRTVENFVRLRELAPDLPIIPVLQGWEPADYLRCIDLYEDYDVDLEKEPLVGVGTVCRRQDTAAGKEIMSLLAARDLKLHGYGVKTTGLKSFSAEMVSADSMAWSYRARRDAQDRVAAGLPPTTCGKKTCANCLHFALDWRKKLLDVVPLDWQPNRRRRPRTLPHQDRRPLHAVGITSEH